MYGFLISRTYVQFPRKNVLTLNAMYFKICFYKLYFSKIDSNFRNMYRVIL